MNKFSGRLWGVVSFERTARGLFSCYLLYTVSRLLKHAMQQPEIRLRLAPLLRFATHRLVST